MRSVMFAFGTLLPCLHEQNTFESVLMRWMNLEPVIQSEVRKRKTNVVY